MPTRPIPPPIILPDSPLGPMTEPEQPPADKLPKPDTTVIPKSTDTVISVVLPDREKEKLKDPVNKTRTLLEFMDLNKSQWISNSRLDRLIKAIDSGKFGNDFGAIMTKLEQLDFNDRDLALFKEWYIKYTDAEAALRVQ